MRFVSTVAERVGELGLPEPVADLASRDWDAIVIGAGHNGLTAAAYLARAGWRVLVLERRERVGGACTLERPFSDPAYATSPCAYLVGLLDPLLLKRLADRWVKEYPAKRLPLDVLAHSGFLDGEVLGLRLKLFAGQAQEKEA